MRRALALAAALEVQRDLRRDVVEHACVEIFHHDRDAAVASLQLAPRRQRVDRRLHEVVRERVVVRRARVAHDVAVEQLADGGDRARLGPAAGLAQELDVERAPDHRGELRRAQRIGREPFQTGGDRLADTGRDRRRARDREPPVVDAHRALLDRAAQQLAQEERIALALGVQLRAERAGIDAAAGERREDRLDVARRERAQREISGAAFALEAPPHRAQRVVARDVFGTVRRNDQQLARRGPAGGVLEQRDRRRTRPLHVFEDQQQRALLAHHLARTEERFVHARLLVAGVHRGQRRQRGMQRANLRNHQRERGQKDGFEARDVERRDERFERFGERLVRRRFRERRAAVEHDAAVAERDLPHDRAQARLADPGLATDQHEAPVAADRAVPRVAHRLDLALAAGERQHRPRHDVAPFAARLRAFGDFVVRDQLAQRERLRHGLRAHLFVEPLGERVELRDRTGAIAQLEPQRHHLAHGVLAPRVVVQQPARELQRAAEAPLGARCGDQLREVVGVQRAQALALGEDPLAVELFEQVAFVQRDRFGALALADAPLELRDVDLGRRVRIPAHRARVGHHPRRAVGRRRKQPLEVMQVAPQVGLRRTFALLGPQRERERLARDVAVAVHQQVGQQGERHRRRREPDRLSADHDAQRAEERDPDGRDHGSE